MLPAAQPFASLFKRVPHRAPTDASPLPLLSTSPDSVSVTSGLLFIES